MLSKNLSKRFGKMSLGKRTRSFVDTIFPKYLYHAVVYDRSTYRTEWAGLPSLIG